MAWLQFIPISRDSPVEKEASRFARLFLDIDVDEANCVPTVGSMQGDLPPSLRSQNCTRIRYVSFYRPGIPGSPAAADRHGTEIRIF